MHIIEYYNMNIIEEFKRPGSRIIRIHSVNYRYLLPESVNLYNVYNKFYKDGKSYDLYGWKNDVLIDVYPTYHNITTKNQLPITWRNYIDDVMCATKIQKMDILIYNLRFKKFTNVIHYKSQEETININSITLNGTHKITDSWVTASNIKNYIMEDTLLDILNKKRKRSISFSDEENENIIKEDKQNIIKEENQNIIKEENKKDERSDEMIRMDMGNIFERDIIDQLIKNYYLDFTKICESYDAKSIDKYNNTLKEMRIGTPIIHQAVLHNPQKEEYGCVDLLIRIDWMNKIFNMQNFNLYEKEEKKENIYVIVDIKFNKLQLNVDRITMRNEGMMKVFKSQLCVYNNALGVMQGYLPKYAYILGSGWSISKIENGKTIVEKCNLPFDRCGIIDFLKKDIEIVVKTDEARKWLKELHENEFDEEKPKYNHNYPNMSNVHDHPHKKRKTEIAENKKELTLISYVTPKNRKVGIENNIDNYLHDNINSEKLGIKGKMGEIVDALLNNQKDLDKPIIGLYTVPEKNQIELFLDYEFFYNFSTYETIPYLCGIGSVNKDDDEWKFNNIVLENISNTCQKQMCEETIAIIKRVSQKNKIRIFTWTETDKRILTDQCQKFNLLDEIKDIEWIDGYRFCLDNRINFKDAKSYGLKEIGLILNKHNLTSVNWKSNLSKSNGAYKYYVNNKKWIEKECVLYYNEIDCQMIYEIFKNLRKFQINL